MTATSSTAALFEILSKIKSHRSGGDFYTAWRQLFDTPDNNSVLRELGLLFPMVESATLEASSAAIGFSGRSTNHWRTQVLSAITSATGHNNWEQFRNGIDSHTLGYLELQANLVQNISADQPLSEEKLGEALDQLRNALTQIGLSTLAIEVKAILLRRIRELISAIEDYRFTGNPALFDHFKVASFDIAAAKSGTPEVSSIDGLDKGLSILANAIAVASSVKLLTKPALKLLGIES
ncbi:TPA: hypothetical protein ACGRQA_001132 [Stenotrophomonas maltophilia]